MSHTVPRPKESPDRCALRAQLRGDPMMGTAFPASRLLLVEQPGPWGHSGLKESHFDRDIALELDAKTDALGVRLLAIRKPGRTVRRETRRWAFVDTSPGHERLVWGRYGRDSELLDLRLDIGVGDTNVGADAAPLYLVCAHSRHDVCCALRGRPVAAALQHVRPGRVWECSHVGGERFAANVLVLPTGLLYGRVLPFAAPEFVQAAEQGEVIAALLRGRVGHAPQVQAALAFGYEQLALRKVDQLRVVKATAVIDGQAFVTLQSPEGQVEVTVVVERRHGDGLTCARRGASGAYLAYRPVLAQPL